MFENITSQITGFVQAHQGWAPFIVGVLAFCESLAIVSFFVPATVILVAIGGLIGATGLPFWPMWAAAALGAILGDVLSYVVGRVFKDRVRGSSLLARHKATTDRAFDFMHRWGALGVFVGRFSGPLRAFVPLVAGLVAMPQLRFQAANISSALLWAAMVLSPGTLLGRWLH